MLKRVFNLRGHCSNLAAVSVSLLLTGCVTPDYFGKEEVENLHRAACTERPSGQSAWHISNLYDCTTRTLFIPYQLWTGASWDGVRDSDCMHRADSEFTVNGTSTTTIKGPVDWTHPKLGTQHQIWSREKVNGTKVQYFSCHENGIGRLYDNRRERFYKPGRCKFPAGPGWPIKKRRGCMDTTIEIVNLELTTNNELAALKFKWWVNGRLDHIYRYTPNYGMTDAWRQFQP